MEQLNILIHEKAKEKQEGSHRVAAEIVAGMIRGSKYWTLEMVGIHTDLFINNSILLILARRIMEEINSISYGSLRKS
jgi:hypothetical protein